MKRKAQDQKKIEVIIGKAREYLGMPNPLTVEAAFGRAVKDVLGQDVNPGVWGEYKKAAKGRYLNREKGRREFVKPDELLGGAEQAALARRDAEIEEAEAMDDVLSELRGSHTRI